MSEIARVSAVVSAVGCRTSPAPTLMAYEPSLWRTTRSSFVSKPLPPPPHAPLEQLAFWIVPSGAAMVTSVVTSDRPACSWTRAHTAATDLGEASKASGKCAPVGCTRPRTGSVPKDKRSAVFRKIQRIWVSLGSSMAHEA
jgi:hypothetical protein